MIHRDLEVIMDELTETENLSDTIELLYELASSPKLVNDINWQFDVVVEISWFYPSSDKYEAWTQIFEYTDKWYDAWIKCFDAYSGVRVYAGNNEELKTISKLFL